MDAYILILNWNGWKDTIVCLRSIYSNLHEEFKIVLVDNASTDDSVTHITEALGSSGFLTTESENQSNIPWIVYSQSEGEAGGDTLAEEHICECAMPRRPPVVIIRSEKNGGFAAGNNIGLRYILARNEAPYVWLLNNDTTVEKESLRSLLYTARQKPDVGFVGSAILNAATGRLECCGGGRFYPILGRTRLYMKDKPLKAARAVRDAKLTYLMGGSLLVSLRCIKEIGLLDESFFLYCEEKDWQARAKRRGLGIAVAPASIVHHKGSASTRGLRHLYFYHLGKSTALYLRKHHSPIIAAAGSLLFPLTIMARNLSHPSNVMYAVRGVRQGWCGSRKGAPIEPM